MIDHLPNDIILNIFENIDKIKDLINFSQINSLIYKLLGNKLSKIRIINYINNDYYKYYKYLYTYIYDIEFLQYLLNIAVNNILTVWGNEQNGFYDMRYIFELMYKGCVLDEKEYGNKHFYKHFYYKIKDCIIVNNRSQTINNINISFNLTSLKTKFNYFKKGEYLNKRYIPLITD
jgi:hypothetical protein